MCESKAMWYYSLYYAGIYVNVIQQCAITACTMYEFIYAYGCDSLYNVLIYIRQCGAVYEFM